MMGNLWTINVDGNELEDELAIQGSNMDIGAADTSVRPLVCHSEKLYRQYSKLNMAKYGRLLGSNGNMCRTEGFKNQNDK